MPFCSKALLTAEAAEQDETDEALTPRKYEKCISCIAAYRELGRKLYSGKELWWILGTGKKCCVYARATRGFANWM